MKKQTLAILTTLLAASCAFALPAFNAQGNPEISDKVASVLQQKAQEQKQQDTYVSVYKAALTEDGFDANDINTNVFEGNGFKAVVSIEKINGNSGKIVLEVFAPKGSKVISSVEQHYANGMSNDPHAAVELIVTLNVNGKTGKFTAATVDAIELAYIVDYDAPSQNLPLPNATGKCPKCGAEDPYHCNSTHTGPCVYEAVKPQKPAQETVWERKHDKDCNDEYHCHCPSVVSEIHGIAVRGEKQAVTKSIDNASFTVSVFPSEDGISYKVTPKNNTELKVKVVTDEKRGGDPHQFLDTNLVIEELDGNGKTVKTTTVFIISRDATTF